MYSIDINCHGDTLNCRYYLSELTTLTEAENTVEP